MRVTATTPVDMKRALGGGAYALMGLAKAASLSPYEVELSVPDEPPQRGQMLFMAVGNNRFAGGGFDVAKESSMDDGLLDLAALLSGPGWSPAQLKSELEDPTNPDNTHVVYRQLASFTLRSPRKLHCNLDGEPYLKRTLRFSVLRRHLKVAY